MTEISRIMEYKRQHDELAKNLHAQLEESMQKAKVGRMMVNRTIMRHLDEQAFVCHIQASALQAQAIIFKLIPTDQFFEAIAYDPTRRLYYLIREHVFLRYKERMRVKLEAPRDILYHYVHLNPFIALKYSNPHEPEGRGVTAMVDKGIIYGRRLAANILDFRTFINHKTLTKVKQRQTRKLKQRYLHATRVKIFRHK